MNDLRCIPTYSLRDVRGAIKILTEIAGFEMDMERVDAPPEESVAILRRGDSELRLYASKDSASLVEVLFICSSAQEWNDRLEAAGFSPVMFREIGEPMCVECQITDELRLAFEEGDE